MKDNHRDEEAKFQQELAKWLKQSIAYVKKKGYDLSPNAITRYQEFFDKQAGYREGKNSFEELRAIPDDTVMAARVWASYENNKIWDTEKAEEEAERQRIQRTWTNLNTLENRLSKEDEDLQGMIAELKEDITILFTRIEEDHFYKYLNDDELE